MLAPPKRARSGTSDLPHETEKVRWTKEFQSDKLSFGRQTKLEVDFTEREVRRNAKSMQEIYVFICTIRRMTASTMRLSDKI